jgi:hypothetical protein
VALLDEMIEAMMRVTLASFAIARCNPPPP